MRSVFALTSLAVTLVAAPVFAETGNGPAGMWKGTVDRDGTQAPMVLRLKQKNGVWKGRADVDGSASPLTKVQVDGNRVSFAVKGQGTFEGTVAENSLTGSLSGSKKGRAPAEVSLTRDEESDEALNAAIDKVVTSTGP